MLVRVNYSKSEGLTHFDDSIHKTTRNLHFEEWCEILVVWRKDSLELYRDHVSSLNDACLWTVNSRFTCRISAYTRQRMGN